MSMRGRAGMRHERPKETCHHLYVFTFMDGTHVHATAADSYEAAEMRLLLYLKAMQADHWLDLAYAGGQMEFSVVPMPEGITYEEPRLRRSGDDHG